VKVFLLGAALAGAAMAAACGGPAQGGTGAVPRWPDRLPAAEAFGARRGLVPLRAGIHLHSVYSHDACDRMPVDEAGRPDEACLARLRRAICLQRLDAVFLTEHDRRLGEADSLREALLFRDGDLPVELDGRLVAKRQPCPDGRSALWFPGAENRLMPIALDSLPRGTVLERQRFYDADTAGAADLFRALGAVVLLPHPEDLTTAQAIALAPDGIEIYNPHANFAPKHRKRQGHSRLGAYVGLLPFYARWTRAHPDIALLAIFNRNRNALRSWDAMLTHRMVFGFGASDAHENALPWPLADGERGDAYERMLAWVTNILLVDHPDPVAAGAADRIEEAVRGGRFFVAIEAWGTPVGFDFRLEGPAGIAEMGETVVFAPGQTLVVEPPRVSLGGLDPAREPGLPDPDIGVRLYRIDPSGDRELVSESFGDASAAATIRAPVPGEGAYRVEVTIVPRHLEPYLGGAALMREVAWVYSNPIRLAAGP
jgi:hypothetical protein